MTITNDTAQIPVRLDFDSLAAGYARAIGETEQRIYGLAAWRETPYFTSRERAALAFTESVTRLSDTHVPDEAYQDVAAEFSPQEVAALVSLIVTINAWNAISVATRAWVPG